MSDPTRSASDATPADEGVLRPDLPLVRLVQDLDARKQELSARQRELEAALRRAEADRERLATERWRAPVALLTLSEQGEVLEANEAACQLLGQEAAAAARRPLSALVTVDAPSVLELVRACLGADRATRTLELVTPLGERRVVALTAREAIGGSQVVAVDITAARAAEDRLRLLANAALDAPTPTGVAQRLAEAALPGLADLAVVDLVRGSDLQRRVAVVHADPAKAERLRDVEERWGPLPNVSFATLQALQTGQPQPPLPIAPEYLQAAAADG